MGRVNFSHVLSVVARRRRIGALAQVVAAAVLVGESSPRPSTAASLSYAVRWCAIRLQ
jgi:hypothetical protein